MQPPCMFTQPALITAPSALWFHHIEQYLYIWLLKLGYVCHTVTWGVVTQLHVPSHYMTMPPAYYNRKFSILVKQRYTNGFTWLL